MLDGCIDITIQLYILNKKTVIYLNKLVTSVSNKYENVQEIVDLVILIYYRHQQLQEETTSIRDESRANPYLNHGDYGTIPKVVHWIDGGPRTRMKLEFVAFVENRLLCPGLRLVLWGIGNSQISSVDGQCWTGTINGVRSELSWLSLKSSLSSIVHSGVQYLKLQQKMWGFFIAVVIRKCKLCN